jgi:predicted CoA-substrate-specific enzyme activase
MKIGIDLGSREMKLVIFDGRDFLEMKRYDTVEFYRRFGKRVGKKIKIDLLDFHPCLEKVPVEILTEYDRLIITGYGRNNLNVEGAEIISEINAHARGAVYQTGLKNFTLIDLGGQDSKVTFVKDGKVNDFVMNDKCAAGGGRYLENMARVLGMTVEELGEYDENPVEISSTCATFGESEMLGKLMEGYKAEALAAGINRAVFSRILPFLSRFPHETFVLCGGVAKNRAIRRMIEKYTGSRVLIPEHPQFNGAIGCVVGS